MQGTNKNPKLRFKNMSASWEEKRIGDVITEEKRLVYLHDDQEYQLVTVKRRNEGIVPRSNLLGKQILVKNYMQIKEGDYLISKRQIIHGANGVVPKNLDNAIVSNEYLVATSNDDISMDFLALLSRTPDMYRKFLLSSYGVDVEKMVFNVEDWKNRSINLPQISEQKIISDFFNYLDNLLKLNEKKYQKTFQLRSGMLNSIFPNTNNLTPCLRLNGYSDKWLELNLESCFYERNERSGIGELISVTINSGVKKASSIKRRDSSSNDKSNYKKVEVNDIAYNSMRMWQGASGVSNYSGILSPAYTVMTPKENISSLFFSYYFKLPHMLYVFQKNSQGLTSDTWNLKFPMLKKIEVLVPSFEEQQAIGEFFKQIDITLDLQAQKIEKLKNLKTALLEKMFV